MLSVPQVSSVPRVIDALVTAFAAIPTDPDYDDEIHVLDGPVLDGRNFKNAISVGVGLPAVSQDLIFEGRGAAYDEAFDIACLTWAWSGVDDQKQHRDRCLTVIAAVRGIIDAQPLSDVHLRMGDAMEWTQAVDGQGRSCSLSFTIHGSASI